MSQLQPSHSKSALPLGEVSPYRLDLEHARSARRDIDDELKPLLDFNCAKAEYQRQLTDALQPYLIPEAPVPDYLTDEERGRHTYVVGGSGMGKSELLRHFIRQDLATGRGFGLFDPNSALIQRVLADVVHYGYPTDRIIYINPADPTSAVGLNPLELPREWRGHDHFTDQLTSELYQVFADRWADSSWGPRMADLLQNALYLLTEASQTLAELPMLLTNANFRNHCLREARNGIVIQFWRDEYNPLSEKERRQWIAPVLNKVREFLRPAALRSILCQSKSTIDLRQVLDDGYILLVNLNPAEVSNADLLGQLILSKLQAIAFRRKENARPWTLYADEFQDFLATGSAQKFTTLLAQARKFGLNLVLAHQDLAQIRRQDPHLVSSLLTNTDTQIVFASNHADAKVMADQIPGGPKELPDRITVSLTRDRWSQGTRNEPGQYLQTVQRSLYGQDGYPLANSIYVETWQKPRTWQQVLAKQAAATYTRYRYQGRLYERPDQIDLVTDAYVQDGLVEPGALVPLAAWLSNSNSQRLPHNVDGHSVWISCWQFKVEVKTRRVTPDWTQVILGFGPREALLLRRGGRVALLRTPDVTQLTVAADALAELEAALQLRWGRPRQEIERDLLRRTEAFRIETPSIETDDYGSSKATPGAAPRRATPKSDLPRPERPSTTKKPQAPFAPKADDFFEID